MNKIQTTSGWSWDNSYLNVNPLLYTKVSPTKVELPRLLLYNKNLGNELGLPSELSSDVISALAGNGVLQDRNRLRKRMQDINLVISIS